MKTIELGVRWPEYDVPAEPGTIRTFLEGAKELGFHHVTTSDFVVVPNAASPTGAIKLKREEVFTLLAYMAGVCSGLTYMSVVLTLPKRPTLLVAEHAATLARLTEGAFRLGIGIGDEESEYRLLNVDYSSRGARFEEQIAVLRSLWEGSPRAFEGSFHSMPPIEVEDAKSNYPIPIWIAAGGHPVRRTLERIGRLADGIIPPWLPNEIAHDRLEIVKAAAADAGRDFGSIGIEPKISLRRGSSLKSQVGARKDDEEIAKEFRAWADLGATGIEFKTRRCGLDNLDAHLAAMGEFRDVVRGIS